MLTEVNNYWVDENNNQWSTDKWNREDAEEASAGLRNCQNCRDCWNCRDCQDCQDCRGCQNCQNCWDCQDCQNCRDYKDDPARIIGPQMGSRLDHPVVYWQGENVQCVVGCFRGNLDDLEEKVRETHYNNEKHLNDYLKFIKVVRNTIKELNYE